MAAPDDLLYASAPARLHAHPVPQRRGARGHDPPARADEGELVVRVAAHGPLLGVDPSVMMDAEQCEVVDVRRAARGPGLDVMHVGEGDVGAAGETTVPVAASDLPALGRGRISPGPTLVEGVAHIVIEGADEGGITGEPPHDLAVDQTAALELTEERCVLCGLRVVKSLERDVGDDDIGRRCSIATSAGPGAERGDQGVGQALIETRTVAVFAFVLRGG